MKQKLFFLLRILFTLCLIIFIFNRYIDWNSFKSVARQNIIFPVFLAALFVNTVRRFLLAGQTRFSLKPFDISISVLQIFRANNIAAFYSLILPGDIAAGGITWHLLCKDNGKRAETASVLLFLKLYNTLLLFPLAMAGIIADQTALGNSVYLILSLTFCVYSFFTFPFLSRRAASASNKLLDLLIRFIPFRQLQNHIRSSSLNWWGSVETLRNSFKNGLLIKITSFGLFSHILAIYGFYLILKATGINSISLFAGVWLLCIVTLINSMPVTLGGIGVREFTLIALLKNIYKIAPEKSLLFSSAILVSTLFFGIVLGGLFSLLPGKTITRSYDKKL